MSKAKRTKTSKIRKYREKGRRFTWLFSKLSRIMKPSPTTPVKVTPARLDIRRLLALYREYLKTNKDRLFKDAPRRSDMRVCEAVYHFNLYAYLNDYLSQRRGLVLPEFPTGCGKIDLLIRYGDETYGIELKSFTDRSAYRRALQKSAQYGKQLGLDEVYLVSFLETVDKKTRRVLETDFQDKDTGVLVKPVFIETGSV